MKALRFPALLSVAVLVSCSTTMDTAGYQKTYAGQRTLYPDLKGVYRNGQTPEQVRASIKRAGFRDLLAEGTMIRPEEGWPAGSLETFHEQANGARVSRIDRFTFGTVRGNTAEGVFYHRVFYDANGRSFGWFVTRD